MIPEVEVRDEGEGCLAVEGPEIVTCRSSDGLERLPLGSVHPNTNHWDSYGGPQEAVDLGLDLRALRWGG